jgi:hypothetical protein
MWRCCYCGEYCKTYAETCRYCSSEGMEVVTSEDVVNNGNTAIRRKKWNGSGRELDLYGIAE